MMDLDLRQLRSFMDVADLGSFSAAADKAELTQPAISLHIRLLEKQLGVRAIKKLAGAGLGLAIVPRMAMEHEGAASGLEWRSLEPPLERRIALAMRRDKHMTAPLRALVAALPDVRKR
ncbi:LysR family transcriptional regulator [Agrobacterium sp. B1(2019)]|uniref:LysR family transcriptional regulator substrate-binding protein n=1 Tax=Agrobacterium sp. B1(2019) TaxID=2607032 RepID=UPI0011EFD386|nr:LysR family transcriptional regulator [Agrobacterium sp. B1(2019)]TZG37571.1 LysR family transcriptional regulator [Agrobacterium sp. B1(2019)]